MKRVLSALVVSGGIALTTGTFLPCSRRRADTRGRRRAGPDPGAGGQPDHPGRRRHLGARAGARRQPAAAGPDVPPLLQPAAAADRARDAGDRLGRDRRCRAGLCADQCACRRECEQHRGHDQGQPPPQGEIDRPRPRYRHRRAADPGEQFDGGADRRFRSPAGRRFRAGDRQSVRPRPDRDLGHHQRARAQRPRHRRLRGFHPDRRLDQSRQFGRSAGRSARPGRRHQYGDPGARRRQYRHRFCRADQHGAPGHGPAGPLRRDQARPHRRGDPGSDTRISRRRSAPGTLRAR